MEWGSREVLHPLPGKAAGNLVRPDEWLCFEQEAEGEISWGSFRPEWLLNSKFSLVSDCMGVPEVHCPGARSAWGLAEHSAPRWPRAPSVATVADRERWRSRLSPPPPVPAPPTSRLCFRRSRKSFLCLTLNWLPCWRWLRSIAALGCALRASQCCHVPEK